MSCSDFIVGSQLGGLTEPFAVMRQAREDGLISYKPQHAAQQDDTESVNLRPVVCGSSQLTLQQHRRCCSGGRLNGCRVMLRRRWWRGESPQRSSTAASRAVGARAVLRAAEERRRQSCS
eukprot:6193356-Pleurochrysis_carterae.AAC.1